MVEKLKIHGGEGGHLFSLKILLLVWVNMEICMYFDRKLVVWFKSRSASQDKEDKVYTRWEQDYNLADIPKLGLFDEYLEMGKNLNLNHKMDFTAI